MTLLRAVAVVVVATPLVVWAGVSDDLRSMQSRLGKLKATGQWNISAERDFVADLDALAVRLRSSGAKAQSAAALRKLLTDSHRHYVGKIDKQRDAIIAADGDLEAAQDSDEWRDREELALQTLYHLNWAYLESATRYERSSTSRRTWLRSAARGFSEFIGAGDAALSAESLYGRGLCMRALDETDRASADFRASLKSGPSEELTPRVRAALIETLIEGEKLSEAVRVSGQLVKTSSSAEADFLRTKVLLLALASLKIDAKTKRAYRNEVSERVARLERRGGRWASLARQLVSAGITRPDEWLDQGGSGTMQWVVAEALRGRGQCAEAIPLYEKLIPRRGDPSIEVLLALGACQFEIGQYDAAYVTLEKVGLDADGGHADAAYLRFKAAEALDHGDPGDAFAERLFKAAREYIDTYPDHPSVFEAYYRLGEMERDRGNLLEASEAFAAVSGDSPLHLQASFQSAQCAVEEWEKRVKQESAPQPELAGTSVDRLRAFLAEAETFGERQGGGVADRAILGPMESRARVLTALVLSSSTEQQDLEEALSVLEGLEERYPGQEDLHAEANALRAIALLGLERFVEAKVAVAAFVASPRRGERDYRLLKQLGVRSMQLAEEQESAGNAEGRKALREQALKIYEELLRAADAGDIDPGVAGGLRELVADLRNG